MIISNETILFLTKILKLPAKGNEQDWAVELSNKDRILEFINIFSEKLSLIEKYAMMSLILASYDDYLFYEIDNRNLWDKISKLLNQNKEIYYDLLNYWSSWEKEDEKNWFNITPIIRNYLIKISR